MTGEKMEPATMPRSGEPMPVREPTTAPIETGHIGVESITKTFSMRRGTGTVNALHDINLDIRPGEFVSFVGPSGCGKSTLLKVIAGLSPPTHGRVHIDGDEVRGPRRSVGIMFQTPELFPWRTVEKNVLLPIEIFGHDKDYHAKRARKLIEMVGLSGFESALPRELSGGMQQRVALSRVLVADPDIILMDEPFGALDEFTREKLNIELLRIWDDERKTVAFVTHNIQEAVFLSDRVVVMGTDPGHVLATIDIALPRPRTASVMKQHAYTEYVFDIRARLGLEAQ